MSSAYGKFSKPTSATSSSLSSFLPFTTTLPEKNISVTLTSANINHPSSLNDSFTPSSLILRMRNVFNEIIEEGNTYAHEFPLSLDEFINYFLSDNAFIVLSEEGIKKLRIEENKVKKREKDFSNDENITWNDELLGMFYIKPNYPGRCNHVCNGGFVVPKQHRDKRIGKLMARSFLKIAPLLGYKSSVFNLVFKNNIASIKLWKNLGFEEIGRIPNAGRLKKGNNEGEEMVDAIMFYYNFDKEKPLSKL